MPLLSHVSVSIFLPLIEKLQLQINSFSPSLWDFKRSSLLPCLYFAQLAGRHALWLQPPFFCSFRTSEPNATLLLCHALGNARSLARFLPSYPLFRVHMPDCFPAQELFHGMQTLWLDSFLLFESIRSCLLDAAVSSCPLCFVGKFQAHLLHAT